MDTFTARTPVDLLAVVPFVIGFHPEDSVVMLTFAGPDRPDGSFHARVDLPLVEEEQREVAGLLRDVAARHGATTVGLVLYTHDVAAARLFGDLAVPGLLRDDVEVIEVIRVDGERFFAVDDPDDPGTPYDLSSHPFTASQVLQGRVVHENRAALRDTLVGNDVHDTEEIGIAATRMVDALVDAARRGVSLPAAMAIEARWLQSTIRELVAGGGQPRPDVAGRLLVLVSFEALREVAWSEMTRSTARQQIELWRGLVRRAPQDLRSGAAALLGFAAWLSGDGALAWCALERCFEDEPDDQLGQYVASLVESATPPSVWAPVPAESLRIFQVEAEDRPQA